MRTFLTLGLSLPLWIACASPELQTVTAACQAELDAIHEAGSFPGATATLILADGRAVQLAAGHTEPQGRPLTPLDRMLVGSTGKTYVAALVHQFVEEGRLGYDDLVSGWFNKADWYAAIPNAETLTVRHLLRHQSGLERYEFKPAFWEAVVADPDRHWQPAELLAYVVGDEPMFPAGQGWAYADTNYIFLGLILEAIAERPFYDLVRERLLVPHGLRDTVPSDRTRIPGMVQGEVKMGQQLGVGPWTLEEGVFTYNVQFEWCGGGFASTSTDLARWARVMFDGRLFSAETSAALLDAVPARELGPGRSYGLGVIVTSTDLGPLQGHDGFMPGYLTCMGYFPELGVAAAVQVNTDNGRGVGMPLHLVLVRLVERMQASLQLPEESELQQSPE